MKRIYFNPICEQFLVEEELLQTLSNYNSAIVTPGAGDLEGDDVVPPGPIIVDDPINGSDDFSKGGLIFD